MNSMFRPVELVNEQTIPLGQLSMISIEYISESITLLETDGDAVILREYFNNSSPEYFAVISQEGESLLIRNGNRHFMMGALRGYVEVLLPKAFYGTLNAKSISGKIEAPGRLVLGELTVASTSGRVQLGQVVSGRAVLSSVSGSVVVQSLSAQADVHSTSGSVRVASAEGNGSYRSVSGSVDVAYQAVTGDIQVRSTSGRIRLCLPALLSFSFDAGSVSGGINVPFAGAFSGGKHAMSGTVGANAQVSVTMRTVSGRIEILPS